MASLLGAICGWGARPEEQYEMIRAAVPPSEAEPRLQEALVVVNALLPAPITLDDALGSLDDTRRLVKARALARTYHACMVNLERLARHHPGLEAPTIDGAVAAHQDKMRRLADTCMATILQMYMSVGAADKSADVLVSQAIRSMAESDVVMEDVAIAERALGLSAFGVAGGTRSGGLGVTEAPSLGHPHTPPPEVTLAPAAQNGDALPDPKPESCPRVSVPRPTASPTAPRPGPSRAAPCVLGQ
uniref:UL51 n=1 Tax=Human herpesvirus 1 TaxID=10298 RepID=A0A2Z4HBB5_HHV1|nr:UL51 [Human alphaherpesvirus 1]AWW12336.1 UL51 [Human alphaherpesvirus 1]WPN78474.1 tegument protein UL51 [Human alphaherpesvirus 1]